MDNVQNENNLSVTDRLASIWQDVLELNEPPGINDDFFDLGGNSLLAIHIVQRITLSFEKTISLQEFFFNSTIADLSEVLKQPEASNPDTETLNKTETKTTSPVIMGLPSKIFLKCRILVNRSRRKRISTETTVPWGLPVEIFQQIRTFVCRWDGVHVGPNSLVVGRNTAGKRPPLFWVFQGEREFLQLASHLGEDQPLYGLRSGHLVMEYTEDTIQALALNYVNEIEKVHLEGPLMIGGNCQGGIIAMAVAQHLKRRRRHVPLLILMEWAFDMEPYSGSVALVFGRESLFANPWVRFNHPELAWRRAFSDYRVEETPGAHGKFFNDTNVPKLASIINSCMEQAMDSAPELLPTEAKRVKIELKNPPKHLIAGTRTLVKARITNCSTVPWNGGEKSGLMLANHWERENDDILLRKDGCVALLPLAPGASCDIDLPITTPLQTGELLLVVQIIEEGIGCFGVDGSTVQLAVQLEDPTTVELS